MKNSLVNAYVRNPNQLSSYSGFEIVTCRELSDYEGGTILEEVKTYEEYLNADEMAIDDPFYRIFAIYKTCPFNTSSAIIQKKAIGDFYNINEAVKFLEELTGYEVNIYSMQ